MSNPSWLDIAIGRLIRSLDTPLTRRSALNFGTGFTVTDDPLKDQTTITTSGGGSVVNLTVATVTALEGLHAVDLTDGQIVAVKNDPTPFQWFAASGAGFAGDHNTVVQLTETLTASAGRFYRMTSSPVVDTIAALRACVSGQHKTIHVRAYATLGDGGGGTFDDVTGVVAAADNTGIIIHAGARVFKRRYDSVFNVKWWGAVGDGTTNDLAAIQAAIDYAHSLVTTVKGGMQNARYIAPAILLPNGRYAVGFMTGLLSGVSHTFSHGIELPDNVSLRGEAHTAIVPHSSIWNTFTVNSTTDVVTSSISVVNGDRVRLAVGNGGVFPGNATQNTDYYVGNVSGSTFKLYSDVARTTVVNFSSNGSGTLWIHKPIALMRTWGFDNIVERIAFIQGAHAVALCGLVRDDLGGYWNPGISPEHLNAFNNCQFNEQTSVAVWLDHTPTSAPGPGAAPFQAHLVFDNCRGYGPAWIWGTFDHCLVNNCVWGWDQNHFVPDTSADGLPLGLFNTNSNLRVEHSIIEGYAPLARGCLFVNAGGALVVDSLTQFDNGSCFVRCINSAKTEYQGPIGEAAVELSSGGAKPYVQVSNSTINVNAVDWCEIYDLFPAILDVQVSPSTQNGTTGIYVHDSVDLRVTETRHVVDQYVRVNGYHGNFTQVRFGNEAARAGGTCVNINERLRPYFLYTSHESKPTLAGRQNNLFPSSAVDSNAITHGGSGYSNTGTYTTPDGYALTRWTASGAASFSFTTPVIPHTLGDGLYTLSFEMRTNFPAKFLVGRYINGTLANNPPVRVSGTGELQRVSMVFPFLPSTLSGGDAFQLFGQFEQALKAGQEWSIGKFQIVKGEVPAPYTRPVDDYTAPTEQITTFEPTTYISDTKPGTGTYNAGDIVLRPAPAAGEVYGWRCTTGGTDTELVFEEIGTLSDQTNPLTVTSSLSGFLDFANAGASVTAGQTVTVEADLVGAERGDDVEAYPLQSPGDGWPVSAVIDNLDKVKVMITNATGSNNPIPGDPLGVNLVVRKHPLFWQNATSFPDPYAWLIADRGIGLSGGAVNTWTDQFGLAHGAGPQATSGKRPTVNAAAVGGRDSLAGTRAANTALPVTWTLGPKNTIVCVLKANTTASSYYFSDGGGSAAFIHKFSGNLLEWYNGVDRFTFGDIGTTGYHVAILSQDDTGNVVGYLGGVQSFSNAATVTLSTRQIRMLFDAFAGGASITGEISAIGLFSTNFDSTQAREMYLRLKGYYDL